MAELEQFSLATLETVIERGLETFIEVAEALARIRDERLYRQAGFTSFETYCQERWGHRRAWADRQITAIRRMEELDPAGSMPANEWQARQLPPPSGDPHYDELVRRGRESVARIRESQAALLAIAVEAIGKGWSIEEMDHGCCPTWEVFIRDHCTFPE